MIDFMSKEDKPVFRIKASAEARSAIDKLATDNDMTREGIAGRVYVWFANQPPVLQRWILSQIPNEMRRDALTRIAGHFQELLEEEEIVEVGRPPTRRRSDEDDGEGHKRRKTG